MATHNLLERTQDNLYKLGALHFLTIRVTDNNEKHIALFS